MTHLSDRFRQDPQLYVEASSDIHGEFVFVAAQGRLKTLSGSKTAELDHTAALEGWAPTDVLPEEFDGASKVATRAYRPISANSNTPS